MPSRLPSSTTIRAVRFGSSASAASTAATHAAIPTSSLKAGITTAKLGAGRSVTTVGRAAREYYHDVTTVLVIGAAGMLGREVVSAAQTAGAEVVPTGTRAQPGWLRFDATRQAPAELFRASRVDLVVNCAAALAAEIDPADPESVERAESLNARFPHALAAAASSVGARLAHISTDAVFRADAGRCLEDDERFADDVYARTKREGEPTGENAITLRCSFIGRDPQRGRGLLAWLLSQKPGAEVGGFVDHMWNGLASPQVAAVCAALADETFFARARAEADVHHLFEDPPISKYELLKLCAEAFGTPVSVVPRESGSPSTRVLRDRNVALVDHLQSLPSRARALAALARRRIDEHD